MNPDQVSSQQDGTENRTTLRYHALAILLLSGVMYYLLDTATDDEVLDISRLLELQEQDYDYFMTDVDSVHYTAAGATDYRFTAERITHFPNPEYSLINAPVFQLFREDASAWQIDSVNGRVELDPDTSQERLVLNEDVIIRGMTADGREMTIYTDLLTVYPQEKRMLTNSDVIVEADGFSSSSTGLTADLNTNTIRQLSGGRLQYEN